MVETEREREIKVGLYSNFCFCQITVKKCSAIVNLCFSFMVFTMEEDRAEVKSLYTTTGFLGFLMIERKYNLDR